MGRTPFYRKIQTRVQSSVYGKIDQLLLAYPGGPSGIDEGIVFDKYQPIFKAFRDRVTFVVMGHFGNTPEIQERRGNALRKAMKASQLDPAKQLVLCHTSLAGSYLLSEGEIHSDFIQDPFLVMESETGTPILLEPVRQFNPENAYVAEQLAVKGDFLLQPCELQIEGGNILVGDDYALVGKNTLHRNLELGQTMDPKAPDEWIENYLKSVLGVRFLAWVGTSEEFDLGEFHNTGPEQLQPFYHLDLFVMLAGKSTTGEEIVYIANLNYPSLGDQISIEDKAMLDRLSAELNRVGDYLRRSGKDYPGPRFDVRPLEIGGKVEEIDGIRRFYPYSYLNAHVETFLNVRRIYLPSFDDKINPNPKIGELEADLLASLRYDGFTGVEFIKNDFAGYAERKGSLHCISKVLTRTYW